MKSVKRITLIFYAAFCALFFLLFAAPESRDPAGSYYLGDHAGTDIYLDLLTDGTYKADWPGCGGSCGSARGAWKNDGYRIVFFPSEEKGGLRGYFTTLNIVRDHWRTVFVADIENALYKRYGPSGRSAFYRRNRPWFVFPHMTGEHIFGKW